MTREEILLEYEAAVASHAAAAAAGIKGAAKSYELFKAGLDALRGPTREMVERMRGEWKHTHSSNAFFVEAWVCSYCGFEEGNGECFNFCPECGQPKTDEAVEMVVERWKEALDNDN